MSSPYVTVVSGETDIRIIQTPNERCSYGAMGAVKKRIAYIGGCLLLKYTTSTQ